MSVHEQILKFDRKELIFVKKKQGVFYDYGVIDFSVVQFSSNSRS